MRLPCLTFAIVTLFLAIRWYVLRARRHQHGVYINNLQTARRSVWQNHGY